MNELVKCAFNQQARKRNCVAYCKYHKCYLTKIHVKNMQCLQKQCKYLVKFEKHTFWIERQKKKERKKEKKNGKFF